MNLQDYTAPLDDYAPRPKASQLTAAAKRARATLEPDSTLTPIAPRRTASPQQLILAAGAGLVIAAFVVMASYQLSGGRPRPLATPVPTIAPRAQEAPAAPFSAPPMQEPADVAHVSVYAAPGGALLGPVETTREITPVAHHGSDWIQAEVEGSGLVWIRAADMPGLAITGPDLAPRVVAPAAAAPAQTWNAPAVEVWTIDIPAEKEMPGNKGTGGDWCRGSHLDNPECQNGSKSIVPGQVK